jgi:predicted Zn-ribbon and HTH transcriptional regulator
VGCIAAAGVAEFIPTKTGRAVLSAVVLGAATILPEVVAAKFSYRRVARERFSRGQCRRCGYDLAAHKVGERCPECGQDIMSKPEQFVRKW